VWTVLSELQYWMQGQKLRYESLNLLGRCAVVFVENCCKLPRDVYGLQVLLEFSGNFQHKLRYTGKLF